MANSHCERVEMDGITSKINPVNANVPQGYVLLPVLFLLYKNGLQPITELNL